MFLQTDDFVLQDSFILNENCIMEFTYYTKINLARYFSMVRENFNYDILKAENRIQLHLESYFHCLITGC